MRTIQKRKSRLGPFVVPAITLAVLAYFGIQSQEGRYGADSRAELANVLARRTADLDKLLAERHALETRVQFMRDGTLERDMVDERARRALNMASEDEIVLFR